jgi:hypothetical protein
MFVYYFSGYFIFDFMVHLPGLNTVKNGLVSVGNGVAHATNTGLNLGRRATWNSTESFAPQFR